MIVGAGLIIIASEHFRTARLRPNPAVQPSKKSSKKVLAAWNQSPARRIYASAGRIPPPTYPSDPPLLPPAERPAFFLPRRLLSRRRASQAPLPPDADPDALTLPALALPSAAKRARRSAHGDDGRCGMILTGAIIAGLIAAYFAARRDRGVCAWPSISGRRCSIAPFKLVYRIDDRGIRLASQGAGAGHLRRRAPVEDRPGADADAAARQHAAHPRRLFGERGLAGAVPQSRPHHRLQRRACVRVAPAGAPVEGQRPARRLFPRRRSSPAPKPSASTGRSPRSPRKADAQHRPDRRRRRPPLAVLQHAGRQGAARCCSRACRSPRSSR